MSENMIACNLSFEDINKLADKVENGKLSKIKIKNGDCEIIIEKENKVMPPMPPVIGAVPSAVSQAPAVQSAAPADTAETSQPSGNVVKAPIVGTYYSAPGPDKAPFVEVGKNVKKGDVLMIIESMKLMNEVQSDFDGVVKEILVENGTAVEFDQPVMIIE
ncbi:acetyl-CoA carboxylase biotin carboxyl carrier protein [Porcipelethomonas sp.]|uniref:acetyl-CoA carboxylase biotin carboxyl carrier protein n=1 Tax=Porcipelethomonas sp. TaxID=2981675 RepID=UPI003EF4E74A